MGVQVPPFALTFFLENLAAFEFRDVCRAETAGGSSGKGASMPGPTSSPRRRYSG